MSRTACSSRSRGHSTSTSTSWSSRRSPSRARCESRGRTRSVAITILEGSNFCISDQNGDFTFTTSGLYAFDTRFLSRLELRINGERPLLLSSGRVEYYSAAFYLRNPRAGELHQDAISIARHRFVGEGMQDRVRVQNQSMEKVGFELTLEIGNDFAD